MVGETVHPSADLGPLEERVGSFAFKAIIPQHFIVTPGDHGRYARNTTDTPHCGFAGLTRLCLEVDTVFRALGDGEGAKRRSGDASFVQVDDKGLSGSGCYLELLRIGHRARAIKSDFVGCTSNAWKHKMLGDQPSTSTTISNDGVTKLTVATTYTLWAPYVGALKTIYRTGSLSTAQTAIAAGTGVSFNSDGGTQVLMLRPTTAGTATLDVDW